MSVQTKAALDAAIQAHLADDGHGEITTAWVLVSSSTSMGTDDGGTVWIETPDGQQRYATLGLLDSGHIMHRGYVYAVMTKGELDDDD